MTAADLAGVVKVARASFPDHFEAYACFAERLALYPQGCFILAMHDVVAGYLIAYPWHAGSAPPLDTLIGRLPARPELIYLHDLALLPEARGLGLTWPIIDRLVTQVRAAGWQRIALVAVNRAAGFWQKMGFVVVEQAVPATSYGHDAAYMVRQLDDAGTAAR